MNSQLPSILSCATKRMRPLTKTPEPPILTANGATWTSEYEDAVAAGGALPRPWRNASVLAALTIETFTKCAYCEGIIADVAYPHVEHITPKSARPDLVVTWSNLTLACQKCNTNKGDYYSPETPLLNPYSDPLDVHIAFRGPALVAKLDSSTGERTIVRLDLQRAPLLMERMKRIEALHNRLTRWAEAEGDDKEMFASLVLSAIADEAEFAGCLREYARSMGFPVQTSETN